jgi:hypothetical protein
MKLVWLKIRGYDFVPRPEAAIASVELARIDACQSVGNGLNIVDVFHAIHFSARALVLGLRVGEPKRIAVSLAHHAVGLSVEGGSRSAARSGRVLERARTIAESTGDARTKALVRLHAGSAAFVEGRFADARLLLESAEREFVERHPGTFWEVNSARTLLLVVNYHLGDIKALLRGGTTWLREAEQRGDVLLALSAVNWPAHLRWLALDDPDEARERLTAAISMWTRRTYQLQHWATLLAETDIDIYERVPGRARIRFREHERPLRRSLMLRSQVARTQHFESRARATLADAASQQGSARRELLEQARMDARGIERAGAPWGMGLTALLEGSVEQLRGRPDLAVVRLRRALAAFESTGQTLHAAVTRWRLGELVGGDEGASLRSQGRQFIVDAGFLSPGRLLDILSPGFASA